MPLSSRTLSWDGCVNIRDLGGHPTADGRATRFGAVVRADSVRLLTDAGWEALLGYGVSRIVDLRLHSELALDPPRELTVEVVHVPLMPDLDDEEWVEIDAVGDAQPDAAGSTRAVYLEFLERRRPQFAEAFAAVANAPEGTVVVHCHGGKDRTGLVVALLLRLVDVDIGTIAADYALSGYNLREQTAAWVVAAEDDLERERRRRIGSAPAEAMVAVLEELERRYSSVREYLGAAGVPDETIDAAAARLL
ncbi:MAG: tyrosine-protein phosphatase [Actinobacteria bacterium]|nr:MAG: tyrosine-protein phosphatase [Actinomycetota bacterium]